INIIFYTTISTTKIYNLSLHDALPILSCLDSQISHLVEVAQRNSQDHYVLNVNNDWLDYRLYLEQKEFEKQDGSSDILNKYLIRSEEHTSELQSRSDLVCRLLLEKKKK